MRSQDAARSLRGQNQLSGSALHTRQPRTVVPRFHRSPRTDHARHLFGRDVRRRETCRELIMKFNTLFALAYSCYARIRANQVQGKRKALLPFSTNQVQGKRKAPTLTPPLPLPLPFSLAANFVATSHDEAGSYSPSALAPIPAPSDNRLRVLMVTGVYPTEERPHAGTFIKSQVDSLITAGLTVDILHPRPGPSPLRYISAAIQVFGKTLTGRYDIVHGHYGLWCL